jgi:type IV pilus assembly protein PilQ
VSGTTAGAGATVGQNPASAPTVGDFNVNLPVAGAAGSIGLAIAELPFGSLLQLELSALEAEGRGEIISTPRVITANQSEAVIEQGVEIPFQEASSSGATSVSFKKAVLSLTVTPQITPDDRVVMDLAITRDSVGQIFAGVPSIDTREVQTQTLVDNGETVVLGGIYEQEENESVTRVPFFGDLPIVGNLFKNTVSDTSKSELLIFVTPKIVKGQASVNY